MTRTLCVRLHCLTQLFSKFPNIYETSRRPRFHNPSNQDWTGGKKTGEISIFFETLLSLAGLDLAQAYMTANSRTFLLTKQDRRGNKLRVRSGRIQDITESLSPSFVETCFAILNLAQAYMKASSRTFFLSKQQSTIRYTIVERFTEHLVTLFIVNAVADPTILNLTQQKPR